MMLQTVTIVVVGGGYAGIHTVQELRKLKLNGEGKRIRIVLLDKMSYHLQKVLLFKPAASGEKRSSLQIPFTKLFPEGVEFVQGTLSELRHEAQELVYTDPSGKHVTLPYDRLVLTIGSVLREPDPSQGGIPLTKLEAAETIYRTWTNNLQQAADPTLDKRERNKLLSVAIAGAGISGIETAGELAYSIRAKAAVMGIDPNDVRIHLINAQSRLFPEVPEKVSRKLEEKLAKLGVTVRNGVKVMKEQDGVLPLSTGESLEVGVCIWTLGIQPNPMLQQLSVPLTPGGYIEVDDSYRIMRTKGAYAIGDCAHIVDPTSGKTDGKTCKEAIAQAKRLVAIMSSDLKGQRAPIHKAYMDFYSIGLGPGHGMVWTRQWGLDMIIGGKLGSRLRQMTWDMASRLS